MRAIAGRDEPFEEAVQVLAPRARARRRLQALQIQRLVAAEDAVLVEGDAPLAL